MSREIPKPNVIWARPLSHYDKKGCQGGGVDAHVVMRKISSKSGKPEPFIVDSFAKQREICRDEQLINPMDLNPNARIDSDGRELMTVGMPGQWSGGVPEPDNSDHWIKSPDWD
ncbi:MAG: hypothetical protein HC888_07965 [Candidatus Competibacteraceae bacterium]|nr:hypothetical protein [Candidatus Competibacteraceae bacterium]